MSGGRWENVGFRISEDLKTIVDDEHVRRRWPKIADMFARLAPIVYSVEHTMDLDLSADSKIHDDSKFERESVDMLQSAVLSGPGDIGIQFPRYTSVIYVPNHANGDKTHKDCERGIVSGSNRRFVFVKFYKALSRFGFKETLSQAVSPENLVIG